MTARVKEGVGRVHRSGHVPAVEVDDDPTAAPLPPIVADDAADEALRRLDDEEAPPVEIRNDIQLVELFAAIDPVPTLPLTAPYEIGLGVVVRRLARVSDQDLGSDANVRRVLRLLGDRLSVTVGPDGISVRGLVRTRHTPWGKLQRLTFTSRYDQVKGQLVAQVADDVAGRLLPVPVPGSPGSSAASWVASATSTSAATSPPRSSRRCAPAWATHSSPSNGGGWTSSWPAPCAC